MYRIDPNEPFSKFARIISVIIYGSLAIGGTIAVFVSIFKWIFGTITENFLLIVIIVAIAGIVYILKETWN